ncbi:MAG: molybdopterin-binding protein [Proteobacteria bacterium]|nr:molybdopterin-binding protein [Pseudomonadota bacterium]
MSNKKNFKNAALLIIGNEILSGRTQDKNINYLAKQLFSHGVSLEEIRIIPDNKSVIVKTIRSLKNNFNYIISTGGIGATHDDITAESISVALKREYCLNKKALSELEKYYKNKIDLTDARKKMAYMPKGSKIILNKVSGAPGFQIENIYVFAGIPIIAQAMMKEFLKKIKSNTKIYVKSLKTHFYESIIAERLKNTELMFKGVRVGSYPIFDGEFKGVEIVMNSYSKKNITSAFTYLKKELNKKI